MNDKPRSSDERTLCPACNSPEIQASVGEFDYECLDCEEEFDEEDIE